MIGSDLNLIKKSILKKEVKIDNRIEIEFENDFRILGTEFFRRLRLSEEHSNCKWNALLKEVIVKAQ